MHTTCLPDALSGGPRPSRPTPGWGEAVGRLHVIPLVVSEASGLPSWATRQGAVMRMWYVIQVQTGQERQMAELIERVAKPQALDECFFPQYETEIKVRGQFVRCAKPLFGGYVIAVTGTPERVVRILRELPQFAHLLVQGDRFVPLAPEEVELIGGFTQAGERVVPMSMAVKVGDDVVVTSGPLKGHEGLISEINRHKSVAILRMELCGRTVSARVGLGVVSGARSASDRAFQTVGPQARVCLGVES